MSETTIYSGTIYFSYSQFLIFERLVNLPGCAWTENHYKQGFARRAQNASFGTLLEFGRGDVIVHLAPYMESDDHDHERVIEIPIELSSGEVVIGGPEEYPSKHIVRLQTGHYRLVVGQTVMADDRETIDIYFERLSQPLAKSRIIVADDSLCPPSPLLETVDVA